VRTLPRGFAPLAERDFLVFFLGRTVSLLGSALAPIALAFGVLEIGGSASDLGLVVAAGLVPAILFILIGGIWSDRLPRHLVMVVSDVISGGAQAVIAVLLLTGQAEVWHFVVVAVVRGAASSFFFPASQGIVPQLVSSAHLQEANALARLSRNATLIGGTALAGVVIAAASPGWALAFDAVTYFVGSAFLLFLHIPRDLTLPERHFVRELREGWDEFRSRTWLWSIVVQFAFVNACSIGAFSVLGPVVANDELGGATAWAAIVTCQSAGFIVGGLVTLRWRPARILLIATLGIFAMVPPLLLLAPPAPTVVIAIAAFVAGFGIELFGVFWDLAMQEQIPAAALSRVYSYDMLGSIVFMPLGAALAGPAADAFGVAETLVAAGVIVLVATIPILFVHDVRTLRRVPAPEPEPVEVASHLLVGAEGHVEREAS
jgi:MFS family permease